MARPKPHVIAKTRKFLRRISPVIGTYMTEFLNEEKLGHGKYRGRPLCKEAWIDRERCFSMKKHIQLAGGEPWMRVTVDIYPEGPGGQA